MIKKPYANQRTTVWKNENSWKKICFRWSCWNQLLSTENASFIDFFILQYAKLRTLELYYKFCDVNKTVELEMDTDSL